MEHYLENENKEIKLEENDDSNFGSKQNIENENSSDNKTKNLRIAPNLKDIKSRK